MDNILTKLFKEPLTYWTSASGRLKDHEASSKVHKDTASLMELFKQRMKRDIVPIDELDNSVRKQRIENGRMKLKSVLKTIILCWQQNFALRVHRDDSRYLDTLLNPGKFQVLLNFRIDSGDSVLKAHFETCPKNATYRSKTVQNELIECCGDHILDNILAEIKEAEFFFSILADEAAGVSNKEQMPILLRFVDKTGHIWEEFLKFIDLSKGTSGENIATAIKSEDQEADLDCKIFPRASRSSKSKPQ